MLKRESFAQADLAYNHLSLSSDLHWPIKFQDFCSRPIPPTYTRASTEQITDLHSQRDSAVSRICEQTKTEVWARKFISFDSRNIL